LTFTNPDDAADAIDNYDLNELPGYAGRGKFLKCSVANINKFAAAESGGDQKFDRPSKWTQRCHGYWADEQSGSRKNGYKSTRRKVERRARQEREKRDGHGIVIERKDYACCIICARLDGCRVECAEVRLREGQCSQQSQRLLLT
jgi:hypothetical protein